MNLYARSLLLLGILGLVLSLGCRSMKVIETQPTYYKMEEQTDSDASIEELIAPYKEGLAAEMDNVIGRTSGNLTKEQPESSLGNFVADAILDIANQRYDETVDIGISNYGGLRILEIPTGPITKRRIFELMPFDNTLVVLEMDKSQLTEFLNHFSNLGGWPISAGLEIAIDTLQQQHQFKLNGESLKEDKIYRVCTSDYIANGGDNCSFLQAIPQNDIQILFRDALLQYVEQTKDIEPQIENRCHF